MSTRAPPFIAGVLVSALAFMVANLGFSSRIGSSLACGDELNNLGPAASPKVVTFRNDSSWVPNNNEGRTMEQVHSKWLSISPRGDGFIKVKDHGEYDLPRPIAKEKQDGVYALAIGHQLHCLYMLMDDWTHLQQQIPGVSPHGKEPEVMRHCFDYLRQSLMCCGDTALEGHHTTYADPNLPSADGWGAKHICKNYDALFDWMEKHRLYDTKTME